MAVKVVGGEGFQDLKSGTLPDYPLRVSANSRYIIGRNGIPFLMIGDSPQPLFANTSLADCESYIATRASQGFNCLMVMLICADYTFGQADGTTFDGIKPFSTGSGPSSYDLSTPNSTYWARMDSMVAIASRYNMCLMLDPIETGSWLTCLANNGATKAYNYGAFIGARYKNRPNILWEHGNDFEAWTDVTDCNLVKQVMQGIADNDPNHLQTVELDFHDQHSSGLDSSTLAPLVTFNNAYTYHPTYDEVLYSYNQSPTMPTHLIEGNYEGENNTGLEPGNAGALVLRKQAYWTMTCGATGSMWASLPSYRVPTDGSWASSMTGTTVTEFGNYHRTFFEGIQWWTLTPDTTNTVLTSGFGTYTTSGSITSNTYATCAADSTSSASLAVIYTPVNHGLVVNMSKFRGSVTARWYDPTNGSYSTVSGSPFTNSGSHTFTPSATNNAGDADWVLLLQA